MAKTPLWQRKAGKSPSGGLTAKGSKSAGVGRPVTQKNPKGNQKHIKMQRNTCCDNTHFQS